MLIIVCMTRYTFGLERYFKLVLNMTVGTGNVAVRTGQSEIRPGRVIEKGFSPGTADMAECAIGTVQAIVRIVRSMTCVTLSRGI
jgi:hypothetical protein